MELRFVAEADRFDPEGVFVVAHGVSVGAWGGGIMARQRGVMEQGGLGGPVLSVPAVAMGGGLA